ncbi:MAG: hypothetical protein Q4G02_00400 [bacterium]|nr:hypothetical protein [bacterium]
MSIYTMRTGVANHPEKTVLAQLTDAVRSGGMIKLSGSNFAVEENNPSSLGVSVQAGRAYLKNSTGGNAYPVISDAVETLTVSSNATSNPRLDTVVLYLDLNAQPDEDNEGKDVAKLAILAGTPAASPVELTDAEIQTALGTLFPFEKLAVIEVAAGATAILNEKITDKRRRAYLKTPRAVTIITDSASTTPDGSLSDQLEVTANQDFTLNLPTNMEIGDWLAFIFVQDNVGNRNLTFNSSFLSMNSDLEPNNLPNKATTYMIEKCNAGFRLYLGGRQE